MHKLRFFESIHLRTLYSFQPLYSLFYHPPPPITPLQESTEKVKQFCEDVQNFSLYTFDYPI